jgi:hypothetical protein
VNNTSSHRSRLAPQTLPSDPDLVVNLGSGAAGSSPEAAQRAALAAGLTPRRNDRSSAWSGRRLGYGDFCQFCWHSFPFHNHKYGNCRLRGCNCPEFLREDRPRIVRG